MSDGGIVGGPQPPLPPEGDDAQPAPPAPSPEAESSPYIGGETSSSGSYRVLTAVIFLLLGALLAGAVALAAYLASHTTLSFPVSEPEPVTIVEETPDPVVTDAAAAEVEPLTAEPCSDFCLDIANRVGAVVVGADGASAWTVSRAWTTAETSVLPAEEAVGADYRSDAGELTFLVWRFADDDSAQAAQDDLVSSTGTAIDSGPAFSNGTGQQSTFADGTLRTIVWSRLGDGTQPWVMEIYGTDVDAVQQFYYALSI
ncbi:hypothetical protein [Streptomyces sp. AC495_CC817]|uniref:hypothetical protein n=1 Tax=Streptomyces sp. AC495_CC817 TaxID=2823900 RepID=UPI001C26E9DF|nr:hypothetical protein [Streptomyces sp. AC495_CC817]